MVAMALALSAATVVRADKPPPPPLPDCNDFLTLFSQPALSCQGFFDKNVLSNGGTDPATQEAAVEALLGINIQNFDYNSYPKQDAVIDFAGSFFGDVVLGMHFGAANGAANNVGGNGATGFFLFHFNSPTDSITTSIPGLSGVVLYANGTPPPPPGVPEPVTWIMMLLGFGAVGFALRRRRENVLAQVA
jgi:hypothetical protein